MNHLMKRLKAIPGVIGGFLFDSRKGIVAGSLPPNYRNAKLLEMCMTVMKINRENRELLPDISEITLNFEKARVILKETGPNILLITICRPEIRMDLLSESIELVAVTIAKKISDDLTAAKAVSPKDLLDSGPMSHSLNGMKTSLAKVLGPFARIIFMDAMKEWLEENEPSYSSMSKLIDILVREIKDPEKVRHFIELIIPFVEPGSKKG